MTQERFQLFKVRPFGDVINDALAFGKRYFRQYGYVILIIVVPTYLIGAFAYASAISTYSLGSGAALNNLKNMGVVGMLAYLVLLVGGLLLHLTFISAFLAIEHSEDGHIDHTDIIRGIREHFGRMLGLTFLSFFVLVIFCGIMALIFYSLVSISAYALIFLVVIGLMVLMVYVMVPMSLASMIYIREGLSFGDTISRAFYLVKGNFWWTFLTLFIASLIGYMVAIVFTAPYMVFIFTKSITSIQSGRASFEMGVLDRVAMAIGQFGTIALSTFIAIAINIQYYSLVEKKDGVSVLQQIDAIGAGDDNVNDLG